MAKFANFSSAAIYSMIVHLAVLSLPFLPISLYFSVLISLPVLISSSPPQLRPARLGGPHTHEWHFSKKRFLTAAPRTFAFYLSALRCKSFIRAKCVPHFTPERWLRLGRGRNGRGESFKKINFPPPPPCP